MTTTLDTVTVTLEYRRACDHGDYSRVVNLPADLVPKSVSILSNCAVCGATMIIRVKK